VQVTLTLPSVILPIALVAAALYWLISRPAPVTRTQRTITVGLTVIFAIGVYLLPPKSLLLPELLGATVPEPISRLVPTAWPVFVLGIAFALAFGQSHRLSIVWRVIMVGTITGVALIILLAYPVYTLTFDTFAPGTAYTGRGHQQAVVVSSFLGILLALAIGPLAIKWVRPRGWQRRLALGAVTGTLAGVVLFGGLTGPAAGLAAQAPLYGVAVSREGFSSAGEWMLKLAIAVNATFPVTYGAFWLMTLGGALVGGVTGLLTTVRTTPAGEEPAAPVFWPLVVLVAGLILPLLAVTTISVFLLLDEVLQNLFDLYGFVPAWRVQWTTIVLPAQTVLVLIGAQILSLLWLHRSSASAAVRRPAALVAILIGSLNLVWVLLFTSMNPALSQQFWSLAFMLVMVALGLEMLVAGWRLRRPVGSHETTDALPVGRSAWATAGAGGGLLAAIFVHYQVTAAILNVVLIAIAMIEELLKETEPPPGVEWLEQMISPLFETHLATFVALTAIGVALGALVGLALASWPWRLSRWIWLQLKAIAHQIAAGIATLRQRRFISAVVVLSASVLGIVVLYLGVGGLVLMLCVFTAIVTSLVTRGPSLAEPIVIGGVIAIAVGFAIVVLGLLIYVAAAVVILTRTQPRARAVAILVGIVLGMAVGYVIGGLRLLPFFLAAIITLLAIRRHFILRLPWQGLALAFGLTLAGIIGLSLQGPYRLPLDASWLWLPYVLLVGPAAAVAYRALTIYSPTGLRLTALLGVTLMTGLLSFLSQYQFTILGGVSRFDDGRQQWTDFASGDTPLSGRLNYRFFSDSQGRLWISGTPGLIIEHTDDGLDAYTRDASTTWEAWKGVSHFPVIADSMRILEDHQGRLWFASSTTFGQFDPEKPNDNMRLLIEVEEIKQPGSSTLSETPDSCVAGIVQLRDSDGSFITALTGHIDQVTSATFSPDGSRIVTASRDSARLWDPDGNPITTLEGYAQDFNSADFSPDGTRIVTVTPHAVWLWDTDGNVVSTQEVSPSQRVSSVSVSPDGTRMLMIIDDNMAQLWSTDGEFIALLDTDTFPHRESRTGGITSSDFSPDGTRIVTVAYDGAARIWDANGNYITTLEGHSDRINSAIFSPDGTRILTVSDDDTARLWDVDGHPITALEGHTDDVTFAVFSPDGMRIATVSKDDTARLWDADGNLITTLEGHTDDVTSAAFSPDGLRLVTVSDAGEARLWDVDGTFVTTVGGDGITSVSYSPDGTRILTAGCVSYTSYVLPVQNLPHPPLDSELEGMALDTSGGLWLATAGDGVLRLDTRSTLDDARWHLFTTANSGLLSNEVHSVYADQAGNVWFGTIRGLSRFNGTAWEAVTAPGLNTDTSVTAFLEDSKGQLCISTTHGGYWWDGQDWTSFGDVTGWPDGASVEALFEDSQGGLWAGTNIGALRFDGQRWDNLVPKVHVTTLAEGPPGVIWVGAQQGLVRYDLAGYPQRTFNLENSELAADWVRDLHVDSDGGLWVSTFTIDMNPRSPWWVIGLSLLFFGYLFLNAYRGYERTPEARALRVGRKIVAEPTCLYPTTYALFVDTSDAHALLTRLADYLSSAQDRTGARAVAALAALAPDAQVDEAVGRIVSKLEADSAREWSESLRELYSLLGTALAARRAPEIAGLELAVNPGREAGSVSLHACSGSVEALPPFLPQGSDEAWYALERVGVALRKYQEVDTASDRLSYLADALSATDAAQTAVQSVGPPDGILLAELVSRWRAAITSEIDAISGRAELRLELRTRQIRRTEQVTLSLRLQNAGRAAAENVVVSLQPGQGLSQVGETQVALERLSSGRSTPVEFVMTPADVETARVVCRVTWDDRVAKGNTIEFADVVRFYEVAEEFRRILNPYIVGHPVKSAEMFYGRGDIFQFIADNLSGPVQDRTLVLHGQRRSGKTSVLYQLLRGRLGQGFVPVLIDMQELAPLVRSIGDFLGEVAYQLARAARKAGVIVEEPASDDFAASPTRAFSRFLDALEDSLGDRRAVLMFDEFELIETKIADGKLDADLLGYFRSLMQHRDRVVFIFTGTHRLEEMSHDYWSILFNIALYRRVSFLSTADAAQLIRKPVAGALDVDELAVEKIINLTSGHPYFIQLICWALVNHCNTQRRNYATINDVNDAVQEMLATGEAYFAYIWQQATEDERLALTGLAHTLRPGKAWARPSEILEMLAAAGDTHTQRAALVDVLDQLVAQEVLEVTREGRLRYRFQLEVLRLWIEVTKPVAALVERGQ
jgi:WD40 repeat protein/AAA+ ATPase superfamily predicted ATPase